MSRERRKTNRNQNQPDNPGAVIEMKVEKMEVRTQKNQPEDEGDQHGEEQGSRGNWGHCDNLGVRAGGESGPPSRHASALGSYCALPMKNARRLDPGGRAM